MPVDKNLIQPLPPAAAWLKHYVVPSLVDAPAYKIDAPSVAIKLDQNESPWDLPQTIKEKVLAKLMARPWNRYPSPFADDLADSVARYSGVAAGSVLLGPGSNYLISLVLSVFGKGFVQGQSKGRLVLARPSFPLYESHCRYDGIPYETWNLDAALEYDPATLPTLPPGSMVVFASPNNPVGNVLKRQTFEQLLAANPETLWVADEAYVEYASEPYTELVSRYANLILLRTFSKTMGCAGVRIGYFIAHPQYLELLKKLRLPYLLNHFSLACIEVLLEDKEMQTHLSAIQRNAVAQRQVVYEELWSLASDGVQVKNSEANFLLLRWQEPRAAKQFYQELIKESILVRDVASGPGLAGCLRITLGDERENRRLIEACRSIFKRI